MSQAPPFEIEEVSIAALHAAYLAGTLTARSVVRAYLDRIEAYDQRGVYLNSLITVSPHALAIADRLDASLLPSGTLTGAFHGLPVIVNHHLEPPVLPTT